MSEASTTEQLQLIFDAAPKSTRKRTDKCIECGAPAQEDHHVIPKSLGGTATVPLCSQCHGRAHGMRRTANISDLTRAGLQRARARGVALGSAGPKNLKQDIEGRRQAADAFAASLADVINRMKAAGMTQIAMVAELNAIGIQTPTGKETPTGKAWSRTQLQRTLARLTERD